MGFQMPRSVLDRSEEASQEWCILPSTCVPSLETKVSTHFRLTAVKPPRLTRITSLLLGLAFPTGPNRDQSLLLRGNIAISPEAREAQH